MRIRDAAQPVADWIWEGETYRPELGREAPIGSIDLARLTGQFAIHEETTPGDHHLIRDRLGVNKLFFAIDEDGQVHSSNFLIELRRFGFPLGAIHSVPSGHSIRLCPAEGRYQLAPHAELRFATGDLDPSTGLRHHASEIGDALERVFIRLARALRGRRVFLTLSGGLDSTTIAALAVRHLDDVTARALIQNASDKVALEKLAKKHRLSFSWDDDRTFWKAGIAIEAMSPTVTGL